MSRYFEGGLGNPRVQYCPCEASEKKTGQKPKSELKELILKYTVADINCHHSTCLQKSSIQKSSIQKKECQNWMKND